jgi:hypothetical protein
MKNQKLQNGKKLNKTVKKKSITGGKEISQILLQRYINKRYDCARIKCQLIDL